MVPCPTSPLTHPCHHSVPLVEDCRQQLPRAVQVTEVRQTGGRGGGGVVVGDGEEGDGQRRMGLDAWGGLVVGQRTVSCLVSMQACHTPLTSTHWRDSWEGSGARRNPQESRQCMEAKSVRQSSRGFSNAPKNSTLPLPVGPTVSFICHLLLPTASASGPCFTTRQLIL